MPGTGSTYRPAGRPFNTKRDAHYLLVGGGLGVPPLIYAAQRLQASEKSDSTAVFGYRNGHFADNREPLRTPHAEHRQLERNVITLLTAWNHKGNWRPAAWRRSRAVGWPAPMMKAVALWTTARGIECQLSMEQRMGCGIPHA